MTPPQVDYITKLKFTMQPTSRYGFRYVSEGLRPGLEGQAKNSWPTVELDFIRLNNMSNDPIEVVCQLVKKHKFGQPFRISPNTLKQYEGDTKPYFEPNFNPICGKMEKVDSMRMKYKYELKNYCIVKCPKEDIEKSLTAIGAKSFPGLVPLPNAEDVKKTFKKKGETVHLAFTAYIRPRGQRQQIAATIYSNGIFNGNKEVHINVCCNPIINIDGGMKIHLLLSDVQKDYMIRISQTNEAHESVWQSVFVEPTKEYGFKEFRKHHNMLAYEAPKYIPNASARTSNKCMLNLYNKNAKNEIVELSAFASVVYMRFSQALGSEVQETGLEDDYNDLTPAEADQIFNAIDMDVINENLAYYDEITAAQPPDINHDNDMAMMRTAFHCIRNALLEAISREVPQLDVTWAEIMRINNVYVEWRRVRSTTTFHLATKMRLWATLRQTFGPIEGTAISAELFRRLAQLQDGKGCTLLHILAGLGIDNYDHDATWLVAKLGSDSHLLQSYNGASFLHVAVDKERVALLPLIEEHLSLNQMRALLDLPDLLGNTALHASIVNYREQSFNWLLKCYERVGVNACESRTLGVGSTPLHLAVDSEERSVFEPPILEQYPDADEYGNYAGYNAYGKYLDGEDLVVEPGEIGEIADVSDDDSDNHGCNDHGQGRLEKIASEMKIWNLIRHK